jgi:hypothetical protein
MNPEEKVRQKMIAFFKSKGFDTETEVKSTCKTSRIDLIIHRNGFVVAFELKSYKRTGQSLAKHLLQAQRYSSLKFQSKFTKEPMILPIFVYPSIKSFFRQIDKDYKPIKYNGNWYWKMQHDINFEHCNWSSFVNEFFNVGDAYWDKSNEDKPKLRLIWLNKEIASFDLYDDRPTSQIVRWKNYETLMSKING